MNQSELRDIRNHPFIWLSIEIDDAPISVDAFRVYTHLCKCAGTKNNAFPSYTTIANKCFLRDYSREVKLNTLRKRAIAAIKELVENGLIRKESRFSGSIQTSNIYYLVDPSYWFPSNPPEFFSDDPEPGSDCVSPGSDCVSPQINRSNEINQGKKIQGKSEDARAKTPNSVSDRLTPPEGDRSTRSETDTPPASERRPKETFPLNTEPVREDTYSAPATAEPARKTDPFFGNRENPRDRHRRQAERKMLADVFLKYPDPIAAERDFYEQLLAYIRATSDPTKYPGALESFADATLDRLNRGIPKPKDTLAIERWERGELEQYRDLQYDPEATKQDVTREKLSGFLAKYKTEYELRA